MVTSVSPVRLVTLTLTLRGCFAAVAGEILPAELQQLLMVFRLSAINRFIVSPVFDLQKVKPADLCAGKFPLAVFFLFPLPANVLVGRLDSNAPNNNKQQDGTKVASDGALARKPRPSRAPPTRQETMEAFPDARLSNHRLKGAFFSPCFSFI